MRPRPRRAGFGYTGNKEPRTGRTPFSWLMVGVAFGTMLALFMRLRSPAASHSEQITLAGVLSPNAQAAVAGSAAEATPAVSGGGDPRPLVQEQVGQQAAAQQLAPVRPRPRGTQEAWVSAKMAEQKCPIYSGPGWRKGRFLVKNTLVAEESLALLPDSALTGARAPAVCSRLPA